MARWKRILNLIFFQGGWFACALSAAWGQPVVGPVLVGALLLLQLPLVPAPGRQVRFVSLAMLFGWLLDSALSHAGVFSFGPRGMVTWLCPLWMAALWANFAGTLHSGLSWLRGRYRLACALGACGGPMAYYGGERLSALRLGDSTAMSLAAIAIEWGLVTPALVYLSEAESLDGLHVAAGTSERKPRIIV
jgi:hypothetical protein